MQSLHPLNRLERWLQGWPESSLTVLLLLLAAVIVWVALTGRPLIKAAVAAWVLFP